MTQFRRRYTKEFKDEAIQIALTSGRTHREIASDLGVGRSTLTRWIIRSLNRPANPSDKQGDASTITEMNQQLLRENKSLRQERDILKQLVAFYMRMQVGEVRSSIRRNS